MTEHYFGPVVFDGVDDTVYLELSIDDLDSPDWIGLGTPGHDVPGSTAVGEYRVKLIGVGNPRRGQSAMAQVEYEVEDGVLRFAGRTSFR
ncbi:MAG: hypothetical protein E6G14_15835 [Actinobacteria bacterium]|nr:MAG: hypothetical protein E6G60_01995 [Actinomycetota bacterium]TML65822.1 MAG: hypothetical protein E6G14_15835 [Actinomycetota bacterium]